MKVWAINGTSRDAMKNTTTIRTHQHFGEILLDVFFLFFFFFKTVLHIDKHSTVAYYLIPSQHWFICLFALTRSSLYVQFKVLSFRQVRFNLSPTQILRHFSLSQQLPTLPTNNITILFPVVEIKIFHVAGFL